MKTRFLLISFAIMALASPSYAKSVCGGEFGMTAHDYRASCNQDASCTVDTFNSLGVGFSFSVSRRNASEPWIIAFKTGAGEPDLSEGIELTVDDGEAMRIPFEFLSKAKPDKDSIKPAAIMIDQTLTEIILEPALSGKQLGWKYTDMKAKAHTAGFSLQGFKATIDWIKCRQNQ